MTNNPQVNPPVTLQEQLYAAITARIADGTYGPGDKLPSEAELMRAHHVSRVTVRKVLEQLVREGALFKRQGKGTFVTSRPYQDSLFSSGSFSENCEMMGAEPSTVVVSIERGTMPADVAELLGEPAEKDGEAVVLARVRLVNGTPCIVEVDFFPPAFDFLLDVDLEGQSVLRLVRERAGIDPSIFTDQFLVASADADHARLLECPEGHALLKVVQTVATAANEPIYVNYQYVMPERYVYVVRQHYTWSVAEPRA